MTRIARVLDASDPRILAQQNRPARKGTKPMSPKQRELITRLCAERDINVSQLIIERFGPDSTLRTLTGGRDGQASDLIGHLFSVGRGTNGTTPQRVEPAEGLYRVENEVVRIKLSKSGNWYAQIAQKRPGRTTIVWEYLGKRIDMRGAIPLTDAEAGKFLGYCVRCNAELTKPESIERGMGPVCAKKGL